jgi:hypothetical protein
MENGQFAYGVLFSWKYKTYNILVLKKKLVIITQNEKKNLHIGMKTTLPTRSVAELQIYCWAIQSKRDHSLFH